MTRKIRIVADEKIPFLKGVFDEHAEVKYCLGNEMNNSMIRDADCLIIRTRTKCNEDLLKGTSVRFIATATIGYDHVDTDYCRKNNISWTNAPGCNSSSVEQYVIASVLEISERFDLKTEQLTLGVVGVGHVGSKVSAAATALGMKVLENDPPRQRNEGVDHFVSLDQLKKESDIITFHVPLNHSGSDKTLGMVNEDFFHNLGKGKVVINTSRGEIMNEDLLLEHLISGTILTAVLDVWNNEPLINRELMEKTAIATPHIAGYSVNGKLNGTTMSVRAVSNFFNLGLNEWQTSNPPKPDNPKIILDCTGMDKFAIVHSVFKESYNVSEDDRRLREDPDDFEKLRGSYPRRFEPTMYNVRLINPAFDDLNEIMEKLGFSVLELDCFC